MASILASLSSDIPTLPAEASVSTGELFIDFVWAKIDNVSQVKRKTNRFFIDSVIQKFV
jgi:hypothetical protein